MLTEGMAEREPRIKSALRGLWIFWRWERVALRDAEREAEPVVSVMKREVEGRVERRGLENC